MPFFNFSEAAVQSSGNRSDGFPFGPYARDRQAPFQLLLVAAALFTSYLAYLTIGLDFSLYRSDVFNYWRESLQLTRPSLWWVPGYPFLIACVRTLTFGVLPPMAIMVLISGVSYVVGVLLVSAIAQDLHLRYPKRVALLFATYPFVGLTYSAWPVADMLATACLLGCYLGYIRRQWMLFTACAACALMAHKVMWFFVPCLMLAAFIQHKESRRVIPLTLVPVAAWLLLGAFYYGDLLWFIRWPVKHLVVSRGQLPILDGLFGPFLQGGLIKAAKGLVVLSIVAVTLACLYLSLRAGFVVGVTLTIPIIVVAIMLNQYEVWAVARFSRVLVIPLAYFASTRSSMQFALESPRVYGILLATGLATNLAYGLYMSLVFFK